MKGTWLHLERHDNWHLKVSERTEHSGEGDPVLVRTSWCHIDFPADAEEKEGVNLSGTNDAVHDDCFRRSEELP